MSDRRYSSSRWRTLRAAVIAEAGGMCQIRGQRCSIVATEVDHITPVVLAPDMFFERENLRASCSSCNASRGASLKNQRTRITIAQLQEMVVQQDYEIARLREQLAAYQLHDAPRRAVAAIR